MSVVAVGIDPSLSCMGLAAAWRGGHETRPVRFPRLDGVPRLLALRNAALEWVAHHRPAIVVLEGYSMAPKAGRLADLGELGGVLKAALWEAGYREPDGTLVVVPPALLKKFATGKGNADKGQVLVAAFKRWGFEAATHDEVDAYVLARIGLALLGEDGGLTAFQRDVLARLRAPRIRMPVGR